MRLFRMSWCRLGVLLCAVAPLASAESPLPNYTEGQEIDRPLVAEQIDSGQFAALRLLALARDHGGNPPPLPFDFTGAATGDRWDVGIER